MLFRSGQHAAGKTGTAQNSGNGWFVGFTPYLSTAVWIGSPADNFEVRIGGRGITGGTYPAEIWGRYMRAYHEGLEEADYEPPPRTRGGRYLKLPTRIDSGGGDETTTSTSEPDSEETTTTDGDGTTSSVPGGSSTSVPGATTSTSGTAPDTTVVTVDEGP